MAENQQGDAQAEQARATQGRQPTPPAQAIANPSITAPHGSAKAGDTERDSLEEPLPRFLGPEWIIVYITAIYVGISALMFLAIKRQSGHMERQTNLQEAALVQWINIGNWKVTDDTSDEKKRLCVRVEITNPSAYPIIVTEGEIKITGHNFPVWSVRNNFFPPQITQLAILYVYVTDFEHQRLFQGGYLTFGVKGEFKYVDVLKKRKKQTLEGQLGCNTAETNFSPSVSMKPQDSERPEPALTA